MAQKKTKSRKFSKRTFLTFKIHFVLSSIRLAHGTTLLYHFSHSIQRRSRHRWMKIYFTNSSTFYPLRDIRMDANSIVKWSKYPFCVEMMMNVVGGKVVVAQNSRLMARPIILLNCGAPTEHTEIHWLWVRNFVGEHMKYRPNVCAHETTVNPGLNADDFVKLSCTDCVLCRLSRTANAVHK